MEGISHEAISLAGHLKLGKLIVLWDDNSISIDGATSLSVSDDQVKRFEASGWNTMRSTATTPKASQRRSRRPRPIPRSPGSSPARRSSASARRTSRASPRRTASRSGAEEIKGAREKLGWPYPPFEVPADILSAWRAAGSRGGKANAAWKSRFDKADAATKALIKGRDAAKAAAAAIADAKAAFAADTSQARDARVVADDARTADPGLARTARRLGRSDAVERHAHQEPYVDRARTISPATTCTTACASTAWPRP